MFGVFVDNLDFDLRAVGLELRADHLRVGVQGLVAAERVGRAVDAEEALPALDPRQEGGNVRERQVPGGAVEDDGVVGLEASALNFPASARAFASCSFA